MKIYMCACVRAYMCIILSISTYFKVNASFNSDGKGLANHYVKKMAQFFEVNHQIDTVTF